jgi:hypothetical protein
LMLAGTWLHCVDLIWVVYPIFGKVCGPMWAHVLIGCLYFEWYMGKPCTEVNTDLKKIHFTMRFDYLHKICQLF